jgi:hypothetical protein
MTKHAWLALPALLVPAFAGAQTPPGPIRIDFNAFATGQPPPGFSAEVTGPGAPGVWVLREDAEAGGKILVQTSTDKTSSRFPLCVYAGLLTHNAVVSVRFKALAGTVDQAAGLVARFRDKDNYYVVRANALEDNVRLYRVVDGKREQFAGADVKVAAGVWHTLRLSLKRYDFEVWLDGQRLFAARDMTHEEAGEVGLWTKADSVTAFADFTIEESDAGH